MKVNRVLQFGATILSFVVVGWAQTQAERADQLVVEVTGGHGARNKVAKRKAERPAVRVLDRAGRPVGGAEVVFEVASSDGAGASFGMGESHFITHTDTSGRARVEGPYRPNENPGAFRIHVTARHGDSVGRTALDQTNVLKPQNTRGSRAVSVAMLVVGASALMTTLLVL